MAAPAASLPRSRIATGIVPASPPEAKKKWRDIAAAGLLGLIVAIGLYVIAREPNTLAEALRIRDPFGWYFVGSFVVILRVFAARVARIFENERQES